MRPDPETVRQLPLFAALSDDELRAVAGHLEVREVSEGEHLTREGATGYFFFVIEEGIATVTRGGDQIAELLPGDFFGEGAILASTRRNATVTAATPMRVVAMFGADFAKLKVDSPGIGRAIEDAMRARGEIPT